MGAHVEKRAGGQGQTTPSSLATAQVAPEKSPSGEEKTGQVEPTKAARTSTIQKGSHPQENEN